MVSTPSPARQLDDVARFIVSGASRDYIFSEGDYGREIYIVQEGQVEILKTLGGSQVRLAVLETGDCFGETELFEDQPRAVSARALTDCKLVRIDPSTFQEIVWENPEIALRVMREICRGWRRQSPGPSQDPTDAPQAQPSTSDAKVGLESARPEAPDDDAALSGEHDLLSDHDLALDEASEPTKRDSTSKETSAVAGVRSYLVHSGSGVEFELSLATDTVVGRADRETGFVPDIDFTSVDERRTVSRRHAKISRLTGGFYLGELLGADNGTFVNGKRVKTALPVKLNDGDRVRLGYVETVFRRR